MAPDRGHNRRGPLRNPRGHSASGCRRATETEAAVCPARVLRADRRPYRWCPGAMRRRYEDQKTLKMIFVISIALLECKAETWLPSPRCSITRQLVHRARPPGRTHRHCTISPECMPSQLTPSVNWSCRRTGVRGGLRLGVSGGRWSAGEWSVEAARVHEGRTAPGWSGASIRRGAVHRANSRSVARI